MKANLTQEAAAFPHHTRSWDKDGIVFKIAAFRAGTKKTSLQQKGFPSQPSVAIACLGKAQQLQGK